MSKTINKIKDKIRRWEYSNLVYGKGYIDKSKGMGKSLADNMQRRGYDAMRISPGITTKFGLKYRKVYGTAVEPNYSASPKPGSKIKKFYPKVSWHLQGYIKAGKVRGSKMLNRRSLLSNFQKTPLLILLMLRK